MSFFQLVPQSPRGPVVFSAYLDKGAIDTEYVGETILHCMSVKLRSCAVVFVKENNSVTFRVARSPVVNSFSQKLFDIG